MPHRDRFAGSTFDDTPLTRGLRRILIGFAIAITLGGAAVIFAVNSLSGQVQGWSRSDVIDAQREALLAAARRFSQLTSEEGQEGVHRSLDELEASIRTGQQQGDGRFAGDALETLAAARDGFAVSVETSEAMVGQQQLMARRIAEALHLSNIWARRLSEQSADIRKEADAIDEELRLLAERRDALTRAMLTAVGLQREVEALRRLHNTPGLGLDGVSNMRFDTSGLPPPCSAAQLDDPGALCRPSSVRVLTTLDALDQASPEQIRSALVNALRAVDAFIRSGEREFIDIAGRQDRLLDLSQDVRRRELANTQAASAHSRISQIIGDIRQIVLQDYPIGTRALEENATRMDFLLPQMRFRGGGLLRFVPDLPVERNNMASLALALEAHWDDFLIDINQRNAAFDVFDLEMSALAASISRRAVDLRRGTEVWVGVFASVSLLITAGLLLLLLFGFFAGRRFFVAPLQQVTGSILMLTRGEVDEPIAIPQTSFGFDLLGRALEDLRRAMVDRKRLSEANAAQTKTIKKNLAELERTTEEMQWLALHDPLTGLGNRRAADSEILRLNSVGVAEGDFCLFHVDVDQFKDTNDTLGHEVGDTMLRHVATALRDCVPEGSTCFRIGGDEFLVVMTEGVTREHVEDVAKKVLEHLNQPITVDGLVCSNSISVGIAFGADVDGDAAAALVNADVALYEAKRAGRGRYVFFTAAMNDRLRGRKELGNRLLAAIDRRQLQPFYQPQFDAKTLQLRGVETLCRWKDPDEGWILPGVFLDLAEDMQLMAQIDQLIFERAAEDVERLNAKGLMLPRISFNVTAQRLTQSDLAIDLRSAFDPGTKVVVELLESMSLDSLTDAMRRSIEALKASGVEVEIDDFGSSRASIAGLISVGPDAMKIDKSLVLPLTESGQHLELVRAIVQIGSMLGIEVIAEGVETEAHKRLLTELGCDVLQGFALARPMPIEALEDLLKRQADGLFDQTA